MIQDIEPHKYDNSFLKYSPKDEDYILIFQGNTVVLKKNEECESIPKYCDVKGRLSSCTEFIYIFSIDEKRFFLAMDCDDVEGKELYKDKVESFRTIKPRWMAFAGFTSYQLYNWYNLNRYCGRCATKMSHSSKERALACESCNNIKYPRISPGVIVGIIDGDNILLTRYAKGPYKKYALVAGFNEIGETLEDTVRREVMEEVGVKVKNIRYYKNQPWGLTSSLLVGFFAELDGDSTITLDKNELSEGVWVKRSDILDADLDISLTQEMIQFFRSGKI